MNYIPDFLRKFGQTQPIAAVVDGKQFYLLDHTGRARHPSEFSRRNPTDINSIISQTYRAGI